MKLINIFHSAILTILHTLLFDYSKVLFNNRNCSFLFCHSSQIILAKLLPYGPLN